MDEKKSIKLKIIAHLDGDLNQEGARELLAWIEKSKENARYYASVKDLWQASLMDATQMAETEQEWVKFVDRIHSKKQSDGSFRIWFELKWRQVLQVAAVLAVGILTGTGISKYAKEGVSPVITASAPLGSVSKITLPDKTEVFLNAGSQIQYTFDGDGKSRGVMLDGEAWFKVFKNDQLPFLVRTAYYNVKVLGTEFNVKAYRDDNQIETTLEKGAVQVISSETLKLKRAVSLKPGEQLIYAKDKETIRVRSVNPKLYTSWKDNKLEFIRMAFGDLIRLLERRYGVNIEVQDKSILQYHYSGTIKNESILEILDILQHTLPIRYEITGQTAKIYKK
ncbi:MAG: FecR family protein [Mangrovibacterium sp.]